MKTIELSETNLHEAAQQASEVLKQGGIVVYPTDTVYGLGADPFNQKAIEKIIRIKGRLATKGIPIVIRDRSQLNRVAKVTAEEEKVIKKYWPGAVTIVLDKTDPVPKLLTGGRDTVAVRQPKHRFIQYLLKAFGNPIAATSANMSGQPVCLSTNEVLGQLKNSYDLIDLVIDAGKLPSSPSSTIIQIGAGRINILRAGAVKIVNQNA